MSLANLLEKTAALLELQAAELDLGNHKKVAASREELASRLGPALDTYERLTGTKLAEDQREAILSDSSSPLIPVLEKLSEQSDEALGMGGPERASKKEASTVEPKPIGLGPAAKAKVPYRKGKRRTARELKQATYHNEQLVHSRYSGE